MRSFFCTDFSASNSSNSCKVSLRNCILPLEGTMSFHELSMLARTCRTPWSVDYLSPPAAFHLHRLRTPPPTSPQLFISAFFRKRSGRSFRIFLFGKDWLHLLVHSAVHNPDSLQWYADNLCIQCLPWSKHGTWGPYHQGFLVGMWTYMNHWGHDHPISRVAAGSPAAPLCSEVFEVKLSKRALKTSKFSKALAVASAPSKPLVEATPRCLLWTCTKDTTLET